MSPNPTDEVNRLRASVDPYTVIKGRRWRRTDPGLDEATRQHLVDALMAARRSVKTALGTGDDEALRQARSRVGDAKIALGERGPTWWEAMTPADVELRSAAAGRALEPHFGRRLANDEAARLLMLPTA